MPTYLFYVLMFFIILFIIYLLLAEERRRKYLYFLYDISGIRYLYEKARPPLKDSGKASNPRPASTIIPFLVAVYTGIYALQEASHDRQAGLIQNQITGLYSQLNTSPTTSPTDAIERIPSIQRIAITPSPEYFHVPKTLYNFFAQEKEIYREGVEELQSIIQIWAKRPMSHERFEQLKKSSDLGENTKISELNMLSFIDLFLANLQGASLYGVNFQGANLEGANLKNAILCEADLSSAEGITVEALKETASLYRVINLEPGIEAELKKNYPHLFDPNEDLIWCYD